MTQKLLKHQNAENAKWRGHHCRLKKLKTQINSCRTKKSDMLTDQLMSENSSVLECCLCNAPAPSAYQLTNVEIVCLFD